MDLEIRIFLDANQIAEFRMHEFEILRMQKEPAAGMPPVERVALDRRIQPQLVRRRYSRR